MQRIFVGDVQGCAEELGTLIERAQADFGSEFELWVAGDLVNRGPGNLRALELIRPLVDAGRAEFILGNHDIYLISVALEVRSLRPADSIHDVLSSAHVADWVNWLRARPLVASGEMAGQRFAMVHASSHPAWSLEDLIEKGAAVCANLSSSRDDARAFLSAEIQTGSVRDDLGRLTRCRSVSPNGDWSSLEPAGTNRPWHAAWSEREHDHGLVYGHWARQGLHIAPGLRGLDTGCVHHGRGRDGFLTAWLPDETRARPFDVNEDEHEDRPGADADRALGSGSSDRIWQIPARRRYYDPDAM